MLPQIGSSRAVAMRLSLHVSIACLVALVAFIPSSSGNAITACLVSFFFGNDDEKELIVTTTRRPIETTSTAWRWQWMVQSSTKAHYKPTEAPKLTTTTNRHDIPDRRTKTCGIFSYGVTRVKGGFETPRGTAPYMAAIRFRNKLTYEWEMNCGGTVIDERFVLTASHCVDDSMNPEDYDVVVGIWDTSAIDRTGQRPEIRRIHLHPEFDDISLANDIALIELRYPVTLNKNVALACLPDSDFDYYAGRLGIVNGWGRSEDIQYPHRLRAGIVPIVDRATCMRSASYLLYRTLPSSAFCAGYLQGGVDTCDGDSGGPLVCQGGDGAISVVGVTSWGKGCAAKNHPGVYTRVASYRTWIDSIMSQAKVVDSSVSSEEGFFD